MVDPYSPLSFRNFARREHSPRNLPQQTTTTSIHTATSCGLVETSLKKSYSSLLCSPTGTTSSSTMAAGLVSVHPRSAFSDSGSSVVSRPVDKSFLKRLFNRSKPRAPTNVSNTAFNSTFDFPRKMSVSSESTIMTMSPSPHTHPLLSKPSARDELRPRTPLAKYSHLDGTISAGGEGFVHSRKMAALTLVRSHPADDDFNIISERELYARNLRGREQMAVSAAEGKYVQEWGFFIKCYAEGRFNLSNPPDPPPRKSEFDHLIAPIPPNEKQRLEAVKACNVSLPINTNDKYHRLVLLAKKVFQTRMAAISFIDEDCEIFKAEHAFNRKYVGRSESIGAHVLLSNEPVVILDTAKDWRLKGNPLVKDAPHIRFYAGAPIITYDGHTIGTFSVFDTQPRDCFTVASRRKLMDFARLSMTEVELVMEEHDMLSRCTSNATSEWPMLKDNDAWPIPPKVGERIAKKTPPPVVSPPPTPKKLKIPKTMTKRDSSTSNSYRLPVRSNIPPAINIPRDSDDGRQSRTSTRVPDMPTPPHTPSRPFSISTAASLSFSRTFNPTPAPPNSLVDTRSSSPAAEETVVVQTRYKQNRPPPIHTPGPREVPLQMPFSPGPITSMAEASFATSIIARSLNYDLVYLLRVSPVRCPEMQLYEDRIISPVDNMYTKILVAHGLPDPLPTFDANLHLRALRSVGGLVYQNPARSHEEDDVGYRLGILLPLLRDGSEPIDEGYCSATTINGGFQSADTCTGGIVLAAFTRKEDREGNQPFTADEVRCLREFGEAMKDILLRVDRRF